MGIGNHLIVTHPGRIIAHHPIAHKTLREIADLLFAGLIHQHLMGDQAIDTILFLHIAMMEGLGGNRRGGRHKGIEERIFDTQRIGHHHRHVGIAGLRPRLTFPSHHAMQLGEPLDPQIIPFAAVAEITVPVVNNVFRDLLDIHRERLGPSPRASACRRGDGRGVSYNRFLSHPSV